MTGQQTDDLNPERAGPHLPIGDVAPPASRTTLFTSLSYDLTWLVRQELHLARTELTEKVIQATYSVSALATGGFLVYTGVITLLLAASFGLAHALSLWLAALILGLVIIVVGILLIQSGRRQLQRLSFVPEKTLATLRADAAMEGGHPPAAAQAMQPGGSAKSTPDKETSMWQVLKETVSEWRKDQASQLAAALAYYTAVSIAPLLVLVVVLVGFFLGKQSAQSQLVTQLTSAVGPQGRNSCKPSWRMQPNPRPPVWRVS